MDVRTGSKSWGYSKRPRNWKKIMCRETSAKLYRDLPEIEEVEEIEEIEEVEEIEEIPEDDKPEIEEGEEKPKIEKPKITARVSKPVLPALPVTLVDREELPRPLVDPASLMLHDPVLPATLVDSSFSYI